MNFKFLAPELHSAAKEVASYFRNSRGVRNLQAEAEVEPSIKYRPTLVGRAHDHYSVCIEVTNQGFSGSLESFVAECGNSGLPVKAYIAVPNGIDDGIFRAVQRRAEVFGVGVIEVYERSCQIRANAVPLTFFGYRRPDPKKFAVTRRAAVAAAEDTLRGGDPVKACARIYDEIEDITRRLGQAIEKRSLWRSLHTGEKRPRVNLKTGPWRRVMELLQTHIDYGRAKQMSPKLTTALMGQVLGIVPHRNDTGHRPTSRQQLIRRDSQLRTRFEHAVDTLEELSGAVRSFRI